MANSVPFPSSESIKVYLDKQTYSKDPERNQSFIKSHQEEMGEIAKAFGGSKLDSEITLEVVSLKIYSLIHDRIMAQKKAAREANPSLSKMYDDFSISDAINAKRAVQRYAPLILQCGGLDPFRVSSPQENKK